MLVQLSVFSARASARMRAMHSVWKTDVALTLSSCAKCMLMIGRCFHCGESSVITSPAVAVGLSRSGDSSISQLQLTVVLCIRSVSEDFYLVESAVLHQVTDHCDD